MRLLNTASGALEYFISDDIAPPYAILSHTWGPEEVTLQQWNDPLVFELEGYSKIRLSMTQARKDGLEWVWIDTCCIDKSNSAELTEAINSMFRWYQKSTVCYAYLADLSAKSGSFNESDFKNSRWFTRGWTLQELIAPSNVVFYSKEWLEVGTKAGLTATIASCTGIEPKFLLGADLESAGIAKRMAWAAHRHTTRPEDIAYSLLGLFDVNMPQIYGEGNKAFQRLQQELLRTFPEDHSIFAWGIMAHGSAIEVSPDQVDVSRMASVDRGPLHGLLASSPMDFAESRDILPLPWAGRFYLDQYKDIRPAEVPFVFGRSVRIELPLVQVYFGYSYPAPAITQIRTGCYALLLCKSEKHVGKAVLVPLVEWGTQQCGRTRELVIKSKLAPSQAKAVFASKKLLHVTPERRISPESGDIIIRQARDLRGNSSGCTTVPLDDSVDFDSDGIVRAGGAMTGKLFAQYYGLRVGGQEQVFAIICSRFRNLDEGDRAPRFHVGILRMASREHNASAFMAAPTHGHTFETPVDTWTTAAEPFPRLEIRVERLGLDGEPGSFVDVVDVLVRDLPLGKFHNDHARLEPGRRMPQNESPEVSWRL